MFDVHPELKCVIQLHEGAYKNFRKDDRKVDIPLITLSDAQWEETRKGLLRPYMYTENEPLYHAGIYMTEFSQLPVFRYCPYYGRRHDHECAV